jgi:hypothetical protein
VHRKAIPYIVLIVLALLVLLIRTWKNEPAQTGNKNETGSTAKEVNRNRGFDRRTSFIEYTQHARCRMACRQITPEEVKEIMENGKINYRKSDVRDRPCPTYALEGITRDNQRVRIVFAQCDSKTKVVTTIDLDRDWTCNCPGDDRK